MVSPAMVLSLRGVQVVFSIIVLGLTAFIVSEYVNWSPASVDFMLFTSIWTLLVLIYLTLAPSRFPRAAHKFAIMGVEALTMLFWFAAFVAVATYWADQWWAGRGTFYNCGITAIVFSALTWVTFVATLGLAARGSPRSDATGPNMAGV
ncbi:hypothetical protein BDW02DRAFT_148118 [Decorospora gaudefroyi]|uniref:MARVEL domain-containing protein n=1 Tax=Decorospora gaudefroyi TaxID=184978 RepID=A0A6A5KX69_9PLEO|nr:hypothetical protein BDW02DRAFT_148118 [Decorospora gaudefroyi]